MRPIKSPFWRQFSPRSLACPFGHGLVCAAWASLLALRAGVKIIDFLGHSSFATASTMKKLLLALLVFIGVERFCNFQTDGFILSKMLLENIPPTPSTPSETLTFIGTGKQFYAFETADHQVVVKFMKFSRRRPLPWLEKLTFLKSWSAGYLAERAKQLSNLESSSALALKYLSAEAALTPYQLPKNLILIDKLGIAHSIDTAQTKFIVQKKAVPFTLYFDQNPSQAQALISSYIKTISSQCRKGICNLDTIIERNYGVANNQMILMDTGSLLVNPKQNHKAAVQHEIFLELLPLREWLKNNHPQHVDYFDHTVENEMKTKSLALF